jgi:hypothetical protein
VAEVYLFTSGGWDITLNAVHFDPSQEEIEEHAGAMHAVLRLSCDGIVKIFDPVEKTWEEKSIEWVNEQLD